MEDLEWYKLNGNFSSSVIITKNKLTINSFDPYIDSGLYGCKAFNGYLTENSTLYIGNENSNVELSGNIHIKISKMPIGFGDEKIMELSCNPSNCNNVNSIYFRI